MKTQSKEIQHPTPGCSRKGGERRLRRGSSDGRGNPPRTWTIRAATVSSRPPESSQRSNKVTCPIKGFRTGWFSVEKTYKDASSLPKECTVLYPAEVSIESEESMRACLKTHRRLWSLLSVPFPRKLWRRCSSKVWKQMRIEKKEGSRVGSKSNLVPRASEAADSHPKEGDARKQG